MRRTLEVSLLLCVMCLIYGAKFPSYLEPCKRNNLKENSCFKKAVVTLKEHDGFEKGIPEFQIPSLNTLVIPKAGIVSGNGLKIDFQDLNIHDCEKFILNDMTLDLDNNHAFVSVIFPTMRIFAKYELEGKILILQLKGSGPANANFTNLKVDATLKLERYLKNNKEHLKIADATSTIEMEKLSIYFDKIFGDNEELNKQTNQFFNDNSQFIYEEIKPIIHDVIKQITVGLAERIFKRFTVDELFPVK